MGISFDKKIKVFHLYTKEFSYYMEVNPLNYLIHLYHGKYLSDIGIERMNERYSERYAFLNVETGKEVMDEDYYFSPLVSRFECASNGKSDKRNPFAVIEKNGVDITNFLYESHEILHELPSDYPYPHVRFKNDEIEILKINLKDEYRNIYLESYYVLSEKYNSLVRFSKLINKEKDTVRVKKISSMELDFFDSDYDILALKGTWGNDRELEKIPLNHSLTKLSHNQGSRGFYYNPSFALAKKDTTLDSGLAYGFSFIYSGDFSIEFKVDEVDQTRLTVGMNPETFILNLKENESFYTPEVLFTYSFEGINKMSQNFHKVIEERIIQKNKAKNEDYIILNSWEAFFFDFDTEKIKNFIKGAKELGIDLVVIDDGWFGKRNIDNNSLGDWQVNEEKINLKEVVDYAHSLDMKIGIWVEPEMISPDSNLYREHSDFALFPKFVKNPTLLRHQLVLDLTRKDVRDYIFKELEDIFDNYSFDYVKWDFNRLLTESFSDSLNDEDKLLTHHKFILGTYDLLDRFTKKYPEILFEGCSAGGGRFNLALLYYCPQIWASDEMDISIRSAIQYSTNIFYPLSSIGAHISGGKLGSIQDKACLAFFGTFGYELNILNISEEDKKQIQTFNGLFKQFHKYINDCTYYAISNPYEGNYVSRNIVSNDEKFAFVYFMNYRKEQTKSRYIKLKGLKKDKYYFNSLTNDIYKGDFYMNVGLNISAILDAHTSMLFVLKEIDPVSTALYKKKQELEGKKKREKLF